MDQKTIGTKVRKYALQLPPDCREDFAQDMWVRLLGMDGQVDRNNIDLILFRAKENWMVQAQSDERAVSVCPWDGVLTTCPVEDNTEAKIEAAEAVETIAEKLASECGYSDQAVDIVVEGLLEDRSWKAIGADLGLSPQLMNSHLTRARKAA